MPDPIRLLRTTLASVTIGLATAAFAGSAGAESRAAGMATADHGTYLGVALLEPVPAGFEPAARAHGDGFRRYYRYADTFDRIELAADADGRVIGISARRTLDRIALANDFEQRQVDALTARFKTDPLHAEPGEYVWRFLPRAASTRPVRPNAQDGARHGISETLATAAVHMTPSHGSFIVTVSFQSRAMATP